MHFYAKTTIRSSLTGERHAAALRADVLRVTPDLALLQICPGDFVEVKTWECYVYPSIICVTAEGESEGTIDLTMFEDWTVFSASINDGRLSVALLKTGGVNNTYAPDGFLVAWAGIGIADTATGKNQPEIYEGFSTTCDPKDLQPDTTMSDSQFQPPFSASEATIENSHAVCVILDANGATVRRISIPHCATEGLGGYNMAELAEARKSVRKQAEAYCQGANGMSPQP